MQRSQWLLSVDVMEHIEEDVEVFRHFHRVLKPGGHVVINTPSDLGGSDVQDSEDESFIGEHVRDGYSRDDLLLVELVGRLPRGIDATVPAELASERFFHVVFDSSGVKPDYDLEVYLREGLSSTEGRFAREMKARLDGETDPADACRVCDPAQASGWTPVELPEIDDLRLEQVTGATRVTWSDPGDGSAFDLAVGELSSLRAEQGVFSPVCLANDVALPTWDDAQPDPAAPDGFYYLVRADGTCGPGTWGFASVGTERRPFLDCP